MILGFPKRIRIQVESAVSVPLRGVSFQPRFKGGKDAGKNPDQPSGTFKQV